MHLSRFTNWALAALGLLMVLGLGPGWTLASNRIAQPPAATQRPISTPRPSVTPIVVPTASPTAAAEVADEVVSATKPVAPAKPWWLVPGALNGMNCFADHDRDMIPCLDTAEQSGARMVVLATTVHQPWRTSTAAGIRPWVTLQGDNLSHFVAEAHVRGIRVVLKPIISIDDDPGAWAGNLAPKSVEAWFQAYTATVVQLLQQGQGFDGIVIGNELSSLQDETSNFDSLIESVRAVQPGIMVAYAANWDAITAVPEMPNWQLSKVRGKDMTGMLRHLDVLAVNAYFPLAPHTGTPTVEELEEAWAPIVKRMRAYASSHSIPLWIGEIGLVSGNGANQKPWTTETARNCAECQINWYKAAARAWARNSIGMAWWGIATEQLEGFNFYPEANTREFLSQWFANPAAFAPALPAPRNPDIGPR